MLRHIRHFKQWPILGQYVWPNPQPVATSYEGEIATLKGWLTDRLKWMDANLVRHGACVEFPVNEKASYIINSYQNPFTISGKLVILSKTTQALTVSIYSLDGKKMNEYYLNLLPGYNTYNIPSAAWSKGMYIMQSINDAGEKKTRKILK